MILESKVQKLVKDEIISLLPDCNIIKNNPESIQGFPDLTVFYKGCYALLETKATSSSTYRPNQQYYLRKFGQYTFTARIDKTNYKEVIRDMIIYLKEKSGESYEI